LDGYWEYKFHTPWKLTVGAAAVIANRFIVSADYEWNGYQGMHFSPRYNNFWSDQNDPYYYANNDIKDYYQSTSSFRIGAEARLTSNLSLRLGYNHTGSPVKEAAKDNSTVIQTAGTRPSYSFDNSIDYITMGLGYRYKKFYLDMAYVHKHRSSEWHAYTPSSMSESTPQAKIASNDDQIVVSMGFKF